jgi:hydrogenase maturation protease
MAELDPPKADRSRRILVLGLGNILLADEGIGAHVAQLLQKEPLPANVEIVDGGTAALDALLLAQRAEKLIVIDALRAGGKPGSIYRAKFQAGEKDKLAEILAGQDGSKISLHQVGLMDALTVTERLNCLPEEIVVIGVEPAEVGYGLELTDEIERKIPEIIDTVVKEIEDAVHTK